MLPCTISTAIVRIAGVPSSDSPRLLLGKLPCPYNLIAKGIYCMFIYNTNSDLPFSTVSSGCSYKMIKTPNYPYIRLKAQFSLYHDNLINLHSKMNVL